MKKRYIFTAYVFCVLTIFLFKLFNAMLFGFQFTTLFEALDTGSAVALAFLAGLAYYEAISNEDWITVVVITHDERQIRFTDAFQREDCSRAELSSILGIHGRFDIAAMKKSELRTKIKRLRASKEKEIEIKLLASDIFVEPPQARAEPSPNKHAVFWNISHHADLTKAQLEASKDLLSTEQTEVIYKPFPDVDPSWSEIEVKEKARELVYGWASELDGESYRVEAALVAGEPIMSMMIASELKRRGVKCYSATSEKLNVEGPDGMIRSRSHFIRYRAW